MPPAASGGSVMGSGVHPPRAPSIASICFQRIMGEEKTGGTASGRGLVWNAMGGSLMRTPVRLRRAKTTLIIMKRKEEERDGRNAMFSELSGGVA